MIPALAVIASSAFLKHQANRQADRRRESLAKHMATYQKGKSREAQAATEQMLEKQTPEARGSELQQLTADRAGSMRDTVGAAQAAFTPGATAGKHSSDYTAAQERAAETVSARTRRAIEQMATMGAPAEQKRQHVKRFGRAAGEVDAANLASDSVGNAYMHGINNVRPDPLLSMVGDIGMGVGTGMAMAPATTMAAPASGMGFEEVATRIPLRQRLAMGLGLFGAGR